jgi:hypothetical protein
MIATIRGVSSPGVECIWRKGTNLKLTVESLSETDTASPCTPSCNCATRTARSQLPWPDQFDLVPIEIMSEHLPKE